MKWNDEVKLILILNGIIDGITITTYGYISQSSAMMNCWDSVGLQVNVVLLSSILLLMNNAMLSMVDLSSELNLQSAVQSAVCGVSFWRIR